MQLPAASDHNTLQTRSASAVPGKGLLGILPKCLEGEARAHNAANDQNSPAGCRSNDRCNLQLFSTGTAILTR